MRKLVMTIVLMVVFPLGGCQAPEKILVISERSNESAIAYQKNMTRIVQATTKAYEKSEKRHHKDAFEAKIEEVAAKNDGKVTPAFVKAMTKLLLNKLDKINANVREVDLALEVAEVDFERYLELNKVLFNYLKQSGIQPEHLEDLRGTLSEAADAWIEKKRLENMRKLEEAARRLEEAEREGEHEGGD